MKRLLLLSLLVAAGSLQAARDWKPARTFVFVVGVLQWADTETFTPFPKENRRDAQLVNFFRRAGVPKNQLVYLQDQAATRKNIRAKLKSLLQKTQPGDLLIVYFCGHGFLEESDDSRLVLASYDAGIGSVTGWTADECVNDIETHFQGNRALLLSDSCFSGGLTDAVRREDRRVDYACLGAATSSEESTANWTFTEAVLQALNGEAIVDQDGDGAITLTEARQYIAAEMRFGEDQATSSSASGEWKKRTVLAAATPVRDARIGTHVEVLSEGDYYKARIVDIKDENFCVFYYGYETADNEWVSADQIRGKSPIPSLELALKKIFQK